MSLPQPRRCEEGDWCFSWATAELWQPPEDSCRCTTEKCNHTRKMQRCTRHALYHRDFGWNVDMDAATKADLLNQARGAFRTMTITLDETKHRVAASSQHHLYMYLVDAMWDSGKRSARASARAGYVMDGAASIRSIARATHMSQNTVKPALQALHDEYWIRWDRDRRRQAIRMASFNPSPATTPARTRGKTSR